MKIESNGSVLRVLKEAGNYGALAAALAANIGEGISRFMIASGGGIILDSAVAGEKAGMVSGLIRVALFVALIAVCIIAKDSLLGSYLEKGMVKLRRRTVNSLGKVKFSWLERRHTGELSARATADLNALGGSLRPVLIWGISQITIQLITTTYMLSLDWLLTLIIFAIVPVTTLLQWIISKPVRKYRTENQNAIGALSSVIYDCFGSFETVKSLSLEKELYERFENAQNRQVDAALGETRILALLTPLAQLGRWLPQFVLVLAGGMFVINGRLSIGQITVFLALSSSALNVIGNIAALFSSLRQLGANAERITQLWDAEQEREGGQVEDTDVIEALCFEDVSFSYAYDEGMEASRALSNVTFSIPRGAFVAFVGESGCGKSTAMKLAASLHEPSEGCLSLFGRDISEWDIEALRARIAYVSQDTYLFPGTLRENICAGAETPSHEELESLVRLVRLDGYAEELPEGLEFNVGERGGYLSGGQRQRISIARALCKKADILLLDEATSALDRETEEEVLRGILKMKNRPTLLMITHRLDNVRKSDQIFVFKDGAICEWGTYDELTKEPGEFARLLALNAEEADV